MCLYVALLALLHSLNNCGITESQRTAPGRLTRFATTSTPLATLEISQAGDTSTHPMSEFVGPIKTVFDALAVAAPTPASERVIRSLLAALRIPTAGQSHENMWNTAHKSFLNSVQIPSSHLMIREQVEMTGYRSQSYLFRTAMQTMAASLK